ncbi:MAG TPA: AAA family ATPase [Saprospiraceae bacterium]|nr:AAA family ATPase [Saprospiraceae bacterium]HMP23070.1 AAA family ATPase [Saprospiraceae bacterium]
MQLESFHIRNYKCFQELNIPKLRQVNLITGKNNTGKTILLEALRIWASEGDASVINNIIWMRGDWEEGAAMKTYASLFHKKKIDNNSAIAINGLDISPIFNKDRTHLDDLLKRRKGDTERYRVNMSSGNKEYPQDVAIYIPASIDFDNKKLWTDIDLTDKKDIVIQILQVIEPSIIDLGIIDNIARVRTKNSKTPVPLKNFGEGLNRLLTIAIALVSAEKRLLLIDEIDTGLHYTVLEKLWEIIFEYAQKLDKQVFVTTHSGDCLDAFSAVANRARFQGLGNYFRLSQKDEGIVAVDYDIKELEMALESNIETR